MTAEAHLHDATVVMRLPVVWIEGECSRELIQCLLIAPEALERHAEIVVRPGIVGRELERAGEARERLFGLPEASEEYTAAAMCCGHVGLQSHGPVVGCERLGVPTHLAQRIAEVGVHVGIGRLDRDRSKDQVDGLLRSSHLAERDAEKVQRMAVARLAEQKLAQRFGRLEQAALLLQGVALRELRADTARVHLLSGRTSKAMHRRASSPWMALVPCHMYEGKSTRRPGRGCT